MVIARITFLIKRAHHNTRTAIDNGLWRVLILQQRDSATRGKVERVYCCVMCEGKTLTHSLVTVIVIWRRLISKDQGFQWTLNTIKAIKANSMVKFVNTSRAIITYKVRSSVWLGILWSHPLRSSNSYSSTPSDRKA